MFDAQNKHLHLGIVGAGLMGRGIAQIAVQAGLPVRLYDLRPGAAGEARAAVADALAQEVARGRLDAAQAEHGLAGLTVAADLADLTPCQLVIEAVVEDLAAKQSLFQQLEALVAETCVLATNTSSLSVTGIAAACRIPERVAGMHFFSPVPRMKVVEIITGLCTDPRLGEQLAALVRRLGHTPVQAADTPGFIVNHAARGYGTEALRILQESITDAATLDRILREGAGFPLGPFELLDLTGLDVSLPVMESLYDQYYQEPRYRPTPLLRQRLAAGLLGRKSGQGFYAYREGRQVSPVFAPAPPLADPPPRFWISPRYPGPHAQLCLLLAEGGVPLDHGERPADDAFCLVLPYGEDATTAALAEGLDPHRTLAVDPLYLAGCPSPRALPHRTLMTTPLTSRAARDAARAALALDGTPVSVIRDSPGFVLQRVLAMVVNVACDMAQQGIASPADIDCAVTLGLAYPLGPLSLGDQLGPETVLTILAGLCHFYRDPRYRPSPWLTRRARLGISLLTPED